MKHDIEKKRWLCSFVKQEHLMEMVWCCTPTTTTTLDAIIIIVRIMITRWWWWWSSSIIHVSPCPLTLLPRCCCICTHPIYSLSIPFSLSIVPLFCPLQQHNACSKIVKRERILSYLLYRYTTTMRGTFFYHHQKATNEQYKIQWANGNTNDVNKDRWCRMVIIESWCKKKLCWG